jgi:hypothetical protein
MRFCPALSPLSGAHDDFHLRCSVRAVGVRYHYGRMRLVLIGTASIERAPSVEQAYITHPAPRLLFGHLPSGKATPMRHQCDIKATPKRVDSQPIGTP